MLPRALSITIDEMGWMGKVVESLDMLRWISREDRLRWIFQEARRRQPLQAEDYCGTYLLSYPRSGNHAVRFAIEFLSRRPTLGADDHESHPVPRGLYDLPIFLRGGPPVEQLRPFAVKRHRLLPIDSVSRLILVERDPVEAVLSHTNRNGEASDEVLLSAYEWWSELRRVFEGFDEPHRLFIQFEDILGGQSDWVAELANFLGLSPKPGEIDACARAVPEAKTALTRPAITTCSTTYRDKFPNQAAVLDRLLEM